VNQQPLPDKTGGNDLAITADLAFITSKPSIYHRSEGSIVLDAAGVLKLGEVFVRSNLDTHEGRD
jgi:hypothetical protein